VPAFTQAQVMANAKILAWAHETHGVPLQLCPNSRPTSRGLAYHRQGIDGNFGSFRFPGRVPGGEVWSESFGKVCPGDRRIAARDQILARAIDMVNGGDWFDMATKADLREVIEANNPRLVRQTWSTTEPPFGTNEDGGQRNGAAAVRVGANQAADAHDGTQAANDKLRALQRDVNALAAKVDEILAKLNEPAAPTP
jgi:hypothetical protein